MIVSVHFRDEILDIEIDHDGGYEYDTNAHEIDWHFYGMSSEEYDALNITPEEEDSIYVQLCKKSYNGLWSSDDVL